MKKLILKLGLLLTLPLLPLQSNAAVPDYDMGAAKKAAQEDFANWMKFLPDDVFVAHVSIPGTHDTATGFGFKPGIGGATYSQTQMARIDQQLDGGIRAFDFRPGTYNNQLYCCHGSDVTNYSMDDAFKLLTDYLEAHPYEFFVIHLFKGNVDSANDTFNKLIDDFFNKGKYADYIIDYDPRLKVKDVRKHIILFRRDRLNFVTFAKAGNFGEWPWEGDVWTETHDRTATQVKHASDPSIKGVVRVSDMSSPDNESEMIGKITAVTNLYDWCRKQATPNSTQNIVYKPDWAMTFTSGEYQGVTSGVKKGGRKGYAYCANKLNQHYTNLINNTPKEDKGPCGIILSDWVLTDYSQDNEYQVYGNELVPAIAMNNFDYIDKFILDDEYFNDNIVIPVNYWDEEKEYFLRNVGTGELLTAGATWGSRAALNPKEGLPVKLIYNDAENSYQIKTTLGNNNGMGYDGSGYFMDYGGLETFVVERASAGKYCFKVKNWDRDGVTQALGAISVTEDYDAINRHGVTLPYVDGTNYVAHAVAYNKEDPMQQWEVIDLDDLFAKEAAKGSYKTPADVSFMYKLKAHKFAPGESSWATTTSNNGSGVWSSIGAETWVNASNNKQCLLHCTNTKASSGTFGFGATNQYTIWKIGKTFTLKKAGKYKIRFKTTSDFNYDNTSDFPFTFKINNTDMISKLKTTKSSYSSASDVISAFRENPDKYTVELDLELGDDASITFDIQKAKTNSVTHFWMDDIELIYYGPDPAKRYVVLVRAIADAKRRLAEMGKTMAGVSENSINFKEYEDGMSSNAYFGEGEEQALEIYEKLRELTYKQTPDDNNHHQDYTNALINAGFETGTIMGWETSYEGLTDVDTGVKPNEGVYVTDPDAAGDENKTNADLQAYLFNCWQADPGPDYRGRGVILSQTIPNLPTGHYTVMAQAANDADNYMFIEVNGQRSEAIQVPPGESMSRWISFDFEVAENTEAVTISFMGGNPDGTFDDFGGNWYKIDDVRIYRSGAADECVFFKRLIEAADRADEIAKETFTPEYYKQWLNSKAHTEFDNLIASHREGGDHSGELGGSNGLEERDKLFTSLSQFALAQKYTEANMSAAIRNNSFELSDLTYWNTQAAPISTSLIEKTGEGDYNIATRHLKNIYYSKHEHEGYAHAYPIYQTINGVPKGHYTLSALVASDNGNKFYIAVNGQPSEKLETTDPKTFQPISMEFEITEDNSDILIGLFPSKDGNFSAELEPEVDNLGPWYAVDNFELKLVGRDITIDWTMETPTHGTIILPFNVKADDLEEKGLEVYSLNYHEDATAQGATHKILKYEPKTEIIANTPYIVMVAGQAVPAAAKSVKMKASSTDESVTGLTYTFEGRTSNKKDTYENEYQDGVLTGVLVPTEVEGSQYHLQSYEDNVGFVLHEEGPDHEALEPYHAYVTLSEDANQTETIHGLYFEEPSLPLEWMMEGDYYGTIILPFAAPLPDKKDMKAYKLTIGDEAKEFGINDEGQYRKYTYQRITLDEGTTELEANTPYLVIKNEAFVTDTEDENAEQLNLTNFLVKPLAGEAEEDEEEENPRLVTFKGISAYDQNSYSDGVMAGVHQNSTIDSNDKNVYTLAQDGKTGMFISNDLGNATDIEKNHAYIRTSAENPVHFLMLTEPQSEEDPNDVETGIDEILAANANVDVYTVGGVLLNRDVPAAETLAKLAPGIYIIRSGKVSVKVIK